MLQQKTGSVAEDACIYHSLPLSGSIAAQQQKLLFTWKLTPESLNDLFFFFFVAAFFLLLVSAVAGHETRLESGCLQEHKCAVIWHDRARQRIQSRCFRVWGRGWKKKLSSRHQICCGKSWFTINACFYFINSSRQYFSVYEHSTSTVPLKEKENSRR